MTADTAIMMTISTAAPAAIPAIMITLKSVITTMQFKSREIIIYVDKCK